MRYTIEEKKWALQLIARAIKNKQKIGKELFNEAVIDYNSKFGKDINVNNLSAWFRYLCAKENNIEVKTRKGVRHSEEEIEWAKDKLRDINRNNMRIVAGTIRNLNLIGEFKERFGRTPTEDAMRLWLISLNDPSIRPVGRPVGRPIGRPPKRKGKDLISQLMHPETIYLLIINGMPLTFSTDEALKDALENPSVGPAINGYKLFKVYPLNVQVSVKIGDDAV